MQNEELRARIKDSVLAHLGDITAGWKPELGLDRSLRLEIGLDSLDMLELFMLVEKDFDVVIPDDYFTNELTPTQMIDVVEKLMEAGDGGMKPIKL